MSPTDIVRGIRTITQKQILKAVPRRWKLQFNFGLQAYSCKPFQSAGSNARSVVANPNTAATKVERLLANHHLAEHLGVVFDSLDLVRPSSYVNVDHSDMNGLTALVGAVQTRNGRAIPCLVETTYALHIPGPGSKKTTARTTRLRTAMVVARRTQSFTGHYIDGLQGLHDRLGFWPRLVFDRGFGNESLLTHLVAEGCTFYVRLKAGRFIELDGQRLQVRELPEKDTKVYLFGLTLRVIQSPKGRRSPEPWYILTNDFESSRDKVVKIYYHRFEIEETFKDMKHIFELRRTRLNKPLSLKVLLWFVSLGIALLYLATKQSRTPIHVAHLSHTKKQTSWLRQAYEQLQQASGLLLWGGI
jgi:hypothetical protein